MANDNEKDKDSRLEEAKRFQQIERESRIIYLNDPIDKDTAFKVNKQLMFLDEVSNDPIKIFVNSPGGEVNSGFFIYDCIKFVRSPVYIIGAGLVASAAALIYIAVDKEYRLSLPHARYMLHQPLSGSRGVVTDLEIHAKEVADLKSNINDIIANATGNLLSKIEKDTDRDFWLNPVEAKKYGLVHTIIESKDDFKKIFPLPRSKEDKKSSGKAAKKETATLDEKSNAKAKNTVPQKSSPKKPAPKKDKS